MRLKRGNCWVWGVGLRFLQESDLEWRRRRWRRKKKEKGQLEEARMSRKQPAVQRRRTRRRGGKRRWGNRNGSRTPARRSPWLARVDRAKLGGPRLPSYPGRRGCRPPRDCRREGRRLERPPAS